MLEEEKDVVNRFRESKFNASKFLLKLFIDIFSIPTNEFSETITRIFSELTVVDEGKDEMN